MLNAAVREAIDYGESLMRGDEPPTPAFAEMPGERFRVRINTHVVVTDDLGNTQKFVAVHDIRRFRDDRWQVRIEKPGHAPTEMSGDGEIPAIIDAEGAVVILIPRRD